MRCDLIDLFDFALGLILSILFLVIGGTGLRQPGRVRYWFEWLHWKQTQWFLGIPPDQLEEPKKISEEEKNLSRYPIGARIVLGGLFGGMMVMGVVFLIILFVYAIEFLSSCFCGR